MVLRRQKKNRKYFGTRRWGVGNIKNARGAGDRGGSGSVGRLRKHDFTYITAKAPWMLRKKGFAPIGRKRLREITLTQINEMLKKPGEKQMLEFRGYKVLSNGELEKAVTIRATGFSKSAMEKITSSGGQAIMFGAEKREAKDEAKSTA